MTTLQNRNLQRVDILPPPASVEPLVEVLGQLYAVIEMLSDAQYRTRAVGVFESSIAAHVRHCLDHVAAFLAVAVGEEIDYDHRERGTQIEQSRAAALHRVAELQRQLLELPPEAMHRSTWVSVMLRSDGPTSHLHSSVGREVAFVLSHTIHHQALIAAMVKSLGGWLPDGFGYAPSTIAHQRQEQGRCARSA
jgi:uncharacterized damage-inducible protein DinB